MRKRDAYFHFKQFSVRHDRCTMKVGTDGVLLGAWAGIEGANQILDIGTGSGVIALMLAQRSNSATEIDAVEIESDDAGQAIENITQSPWAQKVKVHHVSIQDFRPPKKYDLIISNPPYFQNSFKSPDARRTKTRHSVQLSFEDLIAAVVRLLSPEGRFGVILPFQGGLQFIDLARQANLHCTRQFSFRGRAEKPIERWLLEFSITEREKQEGEILLYTSAVNWSENYKSMTKDFYLNL